MLQPPPEEETPSRFAGLAVAAAVAKERRATRPFSQVAPKPDVHLPTAQAGTWSAQRNREKAGGGGPQEEVPAMGTACAPSGSTILTTATILPIRINEAVLSSSSSGATTTTTTTTPPLEQLLREMGVVDDETIEKSLKLQSRLGLYLGGAGCGSKLAGDAARRIVDDDDNDELDEEEKESLTSSLSYQLRNQTEEAGAPCEQAVSSWTVPVAPAIAASTFLEAFARHAPGGDPSTQSKEHSESFRNFFHKEVVDGWAHGNVAAGTYPPGVGTMPSPTGGTPHNAHDCGVIQPIFCRLPPPGAGLPNQGCDLVYPGEMMYIPAPLDKASSSPQRTTSGVAAPLSSSWLLGGLQVGAASMPTTIDPMNAKAFVSPILSTAAETKLRTKEVAYILQLLTPPPEAIIVSKKTDGDVTSGMSALVTDDVQSTLLRRHHWKTAALLSHIDKDLLTTTTTAFSINCRVNLLYLCGFLLSRHAPKSIGRGRESTNTTPPEDALFALSDDSFAGGVPPGVVQAPIEVHSMNHSFFLTIVEKNKELAAGLLQHLFDIKHSFSESADADEVDVETPNHPSNPQTAAQPFNDVDRFYGRIALAFRSCLQALVWLPVLVASSESQRLSSSTVDSANLIVSEPLCYVIKVLSERDNVSLYGSGSGSGTTTTISSSAPILSPAEFAAFVTASTSALMAVSPASAPPTPTASDTRSPMPSSISVPSTTKRGDATAEGTGEDIVSQQLTPRGDNNDAPTLMLGNEFGASATVQLRTPSKANRSISGLDMSGNSGVVDVDTSRQRRQQCQRSAQLLALLLNNIILKRARALHSWDSAQRRNAGSSSSVASTPHASPPPPHSSGAAPDTHPSVLSSLFFDGTVVELTSFALHFRTVKECAELFQTLKRF